MDELGWPDEAFTHTNPSGSAGASKGARTGVLAGGLCQGGDFEWMFHGRKARDAGANIGFVWVKVEGY